MEKTTKATGGQARKIAGIWGGMPLKLRTGKAKTPLGELVDVGVEGYTEPTVAVLLREKWVEPSGQVAEILVGSMLFLYAEQRVSEAGFLALERYFADRRKRRIAADARSIIEDRRADAAEGEAELRRKLAGADAEQEALEASLRFLRTRGAWSYDPRPPIPMIMVWSRSLEAFAAAVRREYRLTLALAA